MLQDYIKVFENVVPLELCDALCQEFCDSEEWVDTTVGKWIDAEAGLNGLVDKKARSCTTIPISRPDVVAKNIDVRAVLSSGVYNAVGAALQQYLNVHPLARIVKDTGYELLRYKTGEFFKQHVDASEVHNRTISCSFGVNDDYEGGEFAFFDRETIIKVPKGGAILFPSNFMFPHEILPVTSGTRYSVVTWLV